MPLQMHQIQKLDDYRWLVPKGTKPGMLTDALIYTDERLLQDLLKDLSLEQAINVAMLPGIVGRSLAMPDIHQGYGFPIGGVAATAHGSPRSTQDLDVVYRRTRANVARLAEALNPHRPYLRDAVPGLPFRCRVLDLDTLIQVKRAAGRPKDFEGIAELELLRDREKS